MRRSLTGAWIETRLSQTKSRFSTVAPSRERGLKQHLGPEEFQNSRRSLTGAWIETSVSARALTSRAVAPSRERGLKLTRNDVAEILAESLPHGSVD